MKLKLLLTHVIVGLLGLFLARSFLLSKPASSEPQSSAARQTSLPSDAGTKSTKSQNSRKTSSAPRSEDYLTAWQALPDQKLSLQDRIATQKRLLREWAKVDLPGAMEAALSEAWDADVNQWLGSGTGPLTGAFGEAFAEDPEGSWLLIQSGKFGVGASLLRRSWYEAVADKDPLLLIRMHSEVPYSDLQTAITLLRNHRYDVQEDYPEIAKSLLALPQGLVKDSDIIAFLPPQNFAEISTALKEIDDFESREASLLIHQLASKFRIYKLGEKNSEALTSLRKQLDGLPDGVQGKFLLNVLTGNDSQNFSGGEVAGTGTLAVLDLMVEGNDWEELSSANVLNRFKYQTNELPAEEVAAWAVALPERAELAEIFQSGVSNYMSENLESSWDWVQEFPSGLWRDRALAEYSQQVLRNNKDYQSSRRALDAIEDADFRAIAEDWRSPRMRALDQVATEDSDPE